MKKSVAEKSISLNEAERRKEVAQTKARKEQREQEAKALRASRPTTYEITLRNSANPGLPAPVSAAAPGPNARANLPKGKADDKDARSPIDEIILTEGVHILADYVAALPAPAAPPPAAPAK